jgi:hypothetical protein
VDFEAKLYEIVRTVYNTRVSGDKKLNDKLHFTADFIEKVTPLNTADNIKKWEFELRQGLKSKVDYLIEDNPDLDIETAEGILEENERINKKFAPADTGNNGDQRFNQSGSNGTNCKAVIENQE